MRKLNSESTTALGTLRTTEERAPIHLSPILWVLAGAGEAFQFDGIATAGSSSTQLSGNSTLTMEYDPKIAADGTCTSTSSSASEVVEEAYATVVPGLFQRPPFIRAPSPSNAVAASRVFTNRHARIMVGAKWGSHIPGA